MSVLKGIIAAVPTPLDAALAPNIAQMSAVLDNAIRQGCRGAIVLGTTGEGPSFDLAERRAVIDAAAAWRRDNPDFLLLAGTGCVAAGDTVQATRHAFEAGCDAVLILPPYFWKQAGTAGIVDYFQQVFDQAVGQEDRVLLYHIPRHTGVPVAGEVLARLAELYPVVVAGLKDSGGDLAHTLEMIRAFPELAIFTGTDSHARECSLAGGAGAITALANIMGRTLAAAVSGHDGVGAVARLAEARITFDRWPSVPAIKALLANAGVPVGPPRPPLVALEDQEVARLVAELALD